MIDENDNQLGVVERYVAMSKARDAGLDLVEVAPDGEPPVCRIMDHGKWLYEQKRKFREGRKKSQQHSGSLKEIRMRPETDKHDLDIKIKHARAFLEKGHKVQFTMLFRGRQMLHQDRGQEVFKGIAEAVEDLAKVEQNRRMANRRMVMMLLPR